PRGRTETLRVSIQVAEALGRHLPDVLWPDGEGLRGDRCAGAGSAGRGHLCALGQIQRRRRWHVGSAQRVLGGGYSEGTVSFAASFLGAARLYAVLQSSATTSQSGLPSNRIPTQPDGPT